MDKVARRLAALAFSLTIAAPAFAGDLVTPPAFAGLSHYAACKLSNVSTAAITGQAQMYDASTGNLLLDSGAQTIAPGTVLTVFSPNPGTQVYCRFVKGSKSKSRGSLTIFPNGGGDQSDEVVVPAT